MPSRMGSRKWISPDISITITARDTVRRVTPPMNAPAPSSANTPGSTHAVDKPPDARAASE